MLDARELTDLQWAILDGLRCTLKSGIGPKERTPDVRQRYASESKATTRGAEPDHPMLEWERKECK